VPDGVPGQLLVRSSGPDPRLQFFKGYLDADEATESAWRGGWFHTGDIVRRESDGMHYFVDRAKHIIRRSGENISAGEVEAVLQAAPGVACAAVVAVPDAARQEEVFACVVPTPGTAGDAEFGRQLFRRCMEQLAYYKAPGWLLFMDELPLTDTQKVQKAKIFRTGIDPTALEGVLDFRSLKQRSR